MTYVGGSGDTERGGTSLERENLACDDPSERTPRGREEEDVDADKRNASLLRSNIVHNDGAIRVLAGGQRAQHGNEELTDSHADSSPEEQGAPANPLHSPQARESRHDVDAGCDHLNSETIFNARVEEVLGAIIEDEVDTSKLLQPLQGHAGQLSLEDRRTKAVKDAGLAEAQLKVVIRLDLSEFILDGRVVGRKASQRRQCLGSLLLLALLDEVSWGLRKEQHAAEEDESPSELDSDRDTIRPSVLSVLGSVVNNGRE